MASDDTETAQGLSLTPDGIFVIQLRSDSAAAAQHLVGRVEHLKSGNSEPFASLTALLGFIARHASPAEDADRQR